MAKVDILYPPKLKFLFDNTKSRYKILYGGRGGAKSHSIAGAFILKSIQEKALFLCTREIQKSIADSVYKLLINKIEQYGLEYYFSKNQRLDLITKDSIRSINGSQTIFKGLKNDINQVKSLEGVKYCWVEEATKVSKQSWDVLIPTIRIDDSEIWLSYNPDSEEDETHKRFIINTPPNAIIQEINWSDNALISDTLIGEKDYLRKVDYEAYLHVWEGQLWVKNDAQIFKDKWEVTDFDTPLIADIKYNRFFFGADWGFSQDPVTLIRSWIGNDNNLYIDYEAYQIGVEIDDLHLLFDQVPESRNWEIQADSARPDLISSLQGRKKRKQKNGDFDFDDGFKIVGTRKWHEKETAKQSYIEAGIDYLRRFNKIIIHTRCKNTINEFKFYSYKVDKNDKTTVLRDIIDKHNHAMDSLRYAYSRYIKNNIITNIGFVT